MNYLRDLIHRLRSGESERRIAPDLAISRVTVHKYHQTAEQLGYLNKGVGLLASGGHVVQTFAL